jgi:hypothetical protein
MSTAMVSKILIELINASTHCTEIDDPDYTFSTFNKEKFASLVVKSCVAELEAHKRCDPYTGELTQCEKNDTIQELILALDELFS